MLSLNQHQSTLSKLSHENHSQAGKFANIAFDDRGIPMAVKKPNPDLIPDSLLVPPFRAGKIKDSKFKRPQSIISFDEVEKLRQVAKMNRNT